MNLMSKKEVCTFLKISNSTLSRYMIRGLPFKKIGCSKSCKVLFDKDDVEKWIENGGE